MGLHEDLTRVVADPGIRRLARRRAGSPQLAEDALQETYRAVAQTKNPENIVDLYAFFRTALIHWINQQLTRPSAVPVPDVGLISDLQQGQAWQAGRGPAGFDREPGTPEPPGRDAACPAGAGPR